MTDLVKRLRESGYPYQSLKQEAADRIEQLEAALDAANDSIERSKDYETELRCSIEQLEGEVGLKLIENEQCKAHIEQLESLVKHHEAMPVEAASEALSVALDRIEQLEAALCGLCDIPVDGGIIAHPNDMAKAIVKAREALGQAND